MEMWRLRILLRVLQPVRGIKGQCLVDVRGKAGTKFPDEKNAS